MIGLDIGTSAIKAVQLAPAGPAYRVAAFATEPLPTGAVVDGVVVDAATVAAAIRRGLQQAPFRPGRVATALPGQAAMVKRITLPAMTPRELHEAIAWEAERHVPFPASDVRLHYERVDHGRAGARTMDVLLVAARRDSIAAIASVIREAGRSAAIVDIGALALLNAYLAHHDVERACTAALLDIGAHATSLSIAVDGCPAFVRHIAVGAAAFTSPVRAVPPIGPAPDDPPFPRHERMKQPHHAQTPSADVEPLIAEVRKTLEFVRTTGGVEGLDRVVVTGGGSLVTGVLERLGDRLGVVVEPLDPLRRVLCSPDWPVETTRVVALAVALAMRREDQRWRE